MCWYSTITPQINDGATSIIVGSHVHHRGNGDYQPLAYIGGSCSVTGYDKIGEEKFWTVKTMTTCI